MRLPVIGPDFRLPAKHLPVIRITASGISCAECKWLRPETRQHCNNPYYQEFVGTDGGTCPGGGMPYDFGYKCFQN